jgi:hypothetical protein
LRSTAIAAIAVWSASAPAAGARSAPQAPRDPSPIVGLCAVPASACSLVAAAGFTVVQTDELGVEAPVEAAPWVARARAYLDVAHRNGLRVLVALPHNWVRQHRTGVARDAMRALRDHPGLCAWHEGGAIAEIGALQFLDRIVRDEDPTHGLVLDASVAGDAVLGLGRARLFAYQPVTRDARRSARLQMASERIPMDELRVPFWPVLQAFGVDVVRGPAKHDLVMPTRTEMEASLASALVAGGRGVFFAPFLHPSAYGDHAAADGGRGYGDYRPLPELAPEAWESVVATARLASRLLQALAGADRSETVRVARAPRGVEVGRWDTSGGTLVVIANLSRRPANIELACDDVPGTIQWLTAPEHALQRDGRRLEMLVPATSGVAFLVRAAAP